MTFIRRCRDFGFTIEQVRDLVGLVDQPERDCVEVRDIAQVHLEEVQTKLAELQATRGEPFRVRPQLQLGVRRRADSGLHHP